MKKETLWKNLQFKAVPRCFAKIQKLTACSFLISNNSIPGPRGGYNKFAGRDISRALAKMSFDPQDLADTHTDDLSDKQKKVLDDWIKTFEDKKGYPIAGNLGK